METALELALAPSEAGEEIFDSIFAVSSGPPPAGIAVIRATGQGVRAALARLAGSPPEPRRAVLRSIVDPATGKMIDRGLVLFFPGPDSFTGEDVLELHLHGGRAVVSAALEALGSIPGFRLAEAGEFTRRAFVAGRMDLTEAEGLSDLITADTSAQRQRALEQMQGSIRRQYEFWASSLTRARGQIEAELDFADEEDVDGVWGREGRELATKIAGEMEKTLAGFGRARAIREGLEIVLLGAVNSGKSTLLNAIAGREVAIVSEEAGTTRDLIEVPVDLGGFKAILVDSAGLRAAEGLVEREGIRRARERASQADLVLWLSDQLEKATLETYTGSEVWTIATKADLLDGAELVRAGREADFVLSAQSGSGVDELLKAIGEWAADRSKGDPPVVTRERHRVALAGALAAIRRGLEQTEVELTAESLRYASEALGRVTGRVDSEAVLDVIFSEFCIGK